MDKLIYQRRATEMREILGVDDKAPIDIINLVGTHSDITLVFYPFKDEISGICIRSANLIAINSNSTLGRQAFSIAHELYHYFYDGEKATISYIDDYSATKIEKEANLFASYLLMPDATFTRLYNKITEYGKNHIELQHILEIEQYFKVSRNAVLIRLISDGYINEQESDKFKVDIIKNAKKHGYDINLYLPSELNKSKTYGAYLKQALELKDLGLISDGKYEEYLLEAYREDIVFDENGHKDIYD
jgi:Zn-dependent peptidase ImmA (M78 family)